MASDADAPRMGIALAVDHDHLGSPAQASESFEEDWRFAEGEQAGHIGERILADRLGDLDDLAGRALPQHNRCIDPRRKLAVRATGAAHEVEVLERRPGLDSERE